MTKPNALEQWQEYKKLNSWQNGNYNNDKHEIKKFGVNKRLEREAMIAEALTFWEFIRETIIYDADHDQIEEIWKKRYDFLLAFLSCENYFMRIIAMIESLPTSIWRKILWKYNIDFMSFEGFFRRIAQGQINAIEANFNDLYVDGKIPQAFSKWDCFWGKLSLEKFFTEDWDYEVRYCNKAAMSYNLLNLDLGFNAYPGGTEDDEKVVEISPLRFLSKKNHADDFVVNTESGKYWWLYKKARSNYVWKPEKKVELNTHICPGFWYTILVHLLFWIVSPIAFMIIAGVIIQGLFLETMGITTVVLTGLGLITPLWLSAALVKFAALNTFTPEIMEKIDNFFQRYGLIIEGFKIAVVIVFLCCVFIVLTTLFFLALEEFLGLISAILIILVICIYFGYKIYYHYEKDCCLNFQYYPKCLRIAIFTMIYAVIIQFLVTHSEQIYKLMVVMCEHLVDILLVILSIFAEIGFVSLLLLVPFMFLGIFYYLPCDEKKCDKILEFLLKVFQCFAYIIIAITIGLIFSAISTQKINYKTLALFLGINVISLIMWFKFKNIDPKIKSTINAFDNARFYSFYETRNYINYSMFLKNSWFQSLNEKKKTEVMKQVVQILNKIDFDDEMERVVCKVFIPKMTNFSLKTVMKKQEAILKLNYMAAKIIEEISLGRTFKKAVRNAQIRIREEKIQEDRKVARLQMIGRIFEIIFSPFALIWKVCMVMATGIGKLIEYTETLYRLYELFNERCPYVTKKRVLR